VAAVVVSRGRTSFLETTLRALAAQTRLPARLLLVDVGPAPDPEVTALLRQVGLDPTPVEGPALSRGRAVVRVLHAPRAKTFGEAVRTAVATLPPADERSWLWLLHDDSAPAPTALAELVRAVEAAPSVGVAGVKQRTWTRPARLLEVGVRTSRSGRRMTDVEPGEVDQGQHDGRDDVLGVGIAGALVRRDVWDVLRGPDPVLGPFGDGFDLSRRARLAGHRVVVVPTAVVRHAQAAYHGLRGEDLGDVPVVDLDADGEPDAADPRRSYAARRTALLHQRLTSAPLPLLPFVAVMAVLAGLVRVLVRVTTKEPVLAAAEIAAPLRALGRPAAVLRARAQARRTRRLPRRTLRPLQADWRTVWQQWRDRRLTRSEARRVVRAPSELELREMAALAVRRRAGLAVAVVALLAVAALAYGRVIVPLTGGASLVGGALLRVQTGLGDLWQAATDGWVAGGLGDAGPADPLLTALLPFAALTGGRLDLVVAVLVLGAVPLAGIGAWFAAGAATRAVTVRVWAAVVWAVLPPLLLASGQGRVGAVLVHVTLPWLVLALARAVGAQRVDVIASGVSTAARAGDDLREQRGVDEWSDPEAWVRDGGERVVRDERRGRRAAERAGVAWDDADADEPIGAGGDPVDDEDLPDQPDLPEHDPETTPVRGVPAVPAPARQPGRPGATVPVDAPERSEPQVPTLTDVLPVTPLAEEPVPTAPAPTRPAGSIAAAAGASLAFALVVAGAPVLLVPGLVALVAVAVCAPRRHRLRVLAAAVPALVLLGPTLLEAAGRGTDGLRLLLADPGSPLASEAQTPLAQLLGVPTDATTLVPTWLPSWVPEQVVTWWPAATGAVVLLVALLALLRGAPQARAVRLGWFVAALGVATAVVSGRVVVGEDGGVPVVGWAGAGVSLATAGLLAAAVLGTRDVQAVLGRATFGWRQPLVVLLAAVAVVVPVVQTGTWAWEARRGDAADLSALDRAVVPAIGRQTQQSQDAPRILALTADADGSTAWQLWRGDGPQLVEEAAAVRTRALGGDLAEATTTAPDEATTELEAVVAALSAGASVDLAPDLAALGIADVQVPPTAAGADAGLGQARTTLVGRLDATPGLERITDGETGVIWRVQPAAPTDGSDDATDADTGAVVQSWARLVPDATAATDAAGLTGEAVAVPSDGLRVHTDIDAGGQERLLVLAERADSGWHATLDGRPLRAVTDGWRQTFAVGPDAGHLVVTYEATDRTAWTVAQGAVGLLALLLALPVRRRRAGRR
jgi:GT2 family glycosyltransferase